jgi:dienelactone hydrolase
VKRSTLPPSLWATCFAAALLSCSPQPRTELAGRWSGEVADERGKTELVLDFAARDGGWTGTMSLPGRRLLGKALADVRLAPPALGFTLPARDGALRFEGRLSRYGIDGTVRAGGRLFPLHLRPAEPVRPPYREEAVAFRSGDALLHGSLLLPAGAGPHPAVILIHGSSTPDRNDFRYFADLFARNGIAALIYDKRDTGGEANGGTASLELLAEDVLAAASRLEKRPDIAAGRIGLWGFSQGGWVAPIAASRRRFAFVVACSAPGVSYADVAIFQEESRLRDKGFSEAEAAEAGTAERAVDAFVRDGGDKRAVQAMLDRARRRPWARFTTLPPSPPTAAEQRLYLRWRDMDLDPAPFWRRVAAPVFLAFGSADRNVPAQESARRIAAALAAGGNRRVTVRLYSGANHELAPAPSLESDMVAWMRSVLESG